MNHRANKRQKELARQQKQRDKAAKKELRRQDKGDDSLSEPALVATDVAATEPAPSLGGTGQPQ